MMDKLFQIKNIMPVDTQILLRSDIETGGWFVHFYYKEEGYELGRLIKGETIFKGYYSDEEIEGALDKIINLCVEKIISKTID